MAEIGRKGGESRQTARGGNRQGEKAGPDEPR
jgi:hypothetical protein